MRKLHGILLCSLSKNRIWGYQEILAEALVVVWITTQISVKFGTSFFPQWQTGRSASDYPTSLDTVLELFGYKVRGCALNGMLAPWRNVPPYSDVPDTDIVTSPLRANLGYAGAVVTVCVTIMLSLSVAGSLIVNRHWRLPKSTHAHMRGCDRITVLLDYHLHCMNADLDKSYEEIPVKSCLAVFGLELLSVVTMFCALVLWIIGCVLPIIFVLAVISIVVVAELGAEAEYPCWVGFVCLLSLHCTGRLWGLWISEGYFSWMRKKFRRPLGVDDPADASRSEEFAEPDAAIPTAADEQERDAHYDSPPALGWTMVIGSLTVLYFVGNLALKLPGLISYSTEIFTSPLLTVQNAALTTKRSWTPEAPCIRTGSSLKF
ncbi:uncharacterized protein LOC129602228 isoform X1 [Paramacrobiotus metropolitanus]|uniref:uncharacterized protein LOC129602228 isoform X1 n=1 Tax=Paramacrobiotus metropolitanus TaxID=2943436 RepID=UPI00244604FD|nr:uncharacterized protein LOC129602228 isoform X1 [Paramacrobiotus metropolitanus]